MSNMALRSGEKTTPATLSGGWLMRLCMRWFFALCLLCLTGCHKNYLYVQQEWVDGNFLASSRIGTPDPRQENPPCGQRLLMSWYFPSELFEQELTLQITVRFWDNSEEQLQMPVESKWSQRALYFPSTEQEKRILTYRIVVRTQEGQIIETWKHHLWTELIQIGN
jgi:hypothetical protein